jgi:type IV pilus assembly protein PilX
MSLPLKRIEDVIGRRQSGATLLVALMMLLIITLLALSSMRGVSLESRITGNLKQQKNLTSAAEAGLRIGEQKIQCPDCKAILQPISVPANTNGDTPTRFGVNDGGVVNAVSATAYNGVRIQWYVVDITSLVSPNSQNSCALLNVGKSNCHRYYEINACASTVLCTSDAVTQRVILRSVVGVSN